MNIGVGRCGVTDGDTGIGVDNGVQWFPKFRPPRLAPKTMESLRAPLGSDRLSPARWLS